MNLVSYSQLLQLVAPETILVVALIGGLAVDLLFTRQESIRVRSLIIGGLAAFGCVAAMAWLLNVSPDVSFGNGMFILDPVTRLIKVALLLFTIFTIAISVESHFTDHVGEYFALLLLATVGMLFMVSSRELLMIFLSLELTSLCLYILAAFNKRSSSSAEAALKYFLFGGMAAAFTLFGLSLIYGLTGSTELSQIAEELKGKPFDPLLAAAVIMTVIGFGFKVAAAPFHLWAPDAYEGAPTPAAALIASGSKVAGFFLFATVMNVGFAGAEGSGAWRNFAPGWVPVIVSVAALSMVFGNLAAITQKNVKRLLAYSAVAHAGYALLGVAANTPSGISSLVYYVLTYALTTLGAFGTVAVVEQATGGSSLSDFAGLSRRAPIVSLCMMVFMLSLAGIPPLAGFFGKFYLFSAAAGSDPKNLGLLWLVILAVAMSVISLYYYLQVLKQIYVTECPDPVSKIRVPLTSVTGLSLLALGVVVLGCAPDLIISRLVVVGKAVAMLLP